jgi:hypothetical protein
MWEESVLLIEATAAEEAERRAAVHARQHEASYLGQGEDVVTWRFEGITAVYELVDQELRDGAELFSRFLSTDEAASLRRTPPGW